MRAVHKKVLALFLLLLTSSCAQKHLDVTFDDSAPEEILKRVALLQNSVKSVKGLASVSIKTPQDKISYTQVTLAEEPDRLRLEALNPFGSTVGFISSDSQNIYIVSQQDRGVYPIDEVFKLAYVYPGLDLDITIEHLVDLVSGRVPKDLFSGDDDVSASSESGMIELTFGDGSAVKSDKLWINPLNNRVEKARIILDTGHTAQINYEYFEGLVEGHYFPKVIDFSTGELAIKITYEPDVSLNTPIDSSLLRPSPGS